MSAIAGRVLLIPKGAYNALTTYNPLDFVTYGANSYVCKQTSVGNLPTNTTYWQLMAQGATAADQITYDNTVSGLTADDVQEAVDELKGITDDLDDAIDAIVNVYGAKNLFKYPYYEGSKVLNGITYTVNSDGTVTASGTASADGVFGMLRYDKSLAKGDYILSNGLPNTATGIYILAYNGTTYVRHLAAYNGGAEQTFTIDYNGYDSIVADYFVPNGTDLTTPVTVKPMIRDARITDATYEPYAQTNRELTVNTNGLIKTGGHNLLPAPHEGNKTENGLTFVENEDGSVTVSGTASADTFYTFAGWANYWRLPKGGYTASMEGSSNNVVMYVNRYNGSTYVSGLGFVKGGETSFDVDYVGYDRIESGFYIVSGTDLTTPLTVYPMVRDAADLNPAYTPFAMTNRELTEKVTPSGYITDGITYYDFTFDNGGYCKVGNLVNLSISAYASASDAGTKKIMDLPASIKPPMIVSAVAQDITGETTPIFCSISPAGEVFAKNTIMNRRYTISATWIL